MGRNVFAVSAAVNDCVPIAVFNNSPLPAALSGRHH